MPSPAEEIKQALDTAKRDFEEFKKENDRRLKLIEEKGSAGADREEKVNKISESISEIEEKIAKIQTAMSRVATEGDTKAVEAKELELSQKYVAAVMRGRTPTEEQKQAYFKQFGPEYQGVEEFKTLSVGSDPDGGYFVRPHVSAEIQKKVHESSPVRQLASQLTIASNAFEELYDNDEPDSGWVGEMSSRSATGTNQINKIRISTHELHASPKATQMLLDDAGVNVEMWHMGKVVDKFARDEATAFVSGNGVSKPTGFLSYTAGDGFNKIEQVNSGSAGAVAADGLISLQDALLEAFQANAVWLMRRATATAVRKLKDANDRYLYSIGGDLVSGAPGLLLGKPVHFAADMPAIAADALSIAYGDFRAGYLVIDRIGIRVLRDPYTSKGQVIFYTTKRVGGGVRQFQAIKLQKLAA